MLEVERPNRVRLAAECRGKCPMCARVLSLAPSGRIGDGVFRSLGCASAYHYERQALPPCERSTRARVSFEPGTGTFRR